MEVNIVTWSVLRSVTIASNISCDFHTHLAASTTSISMYCLSRPYCVRLAKTFSPHSEENDREVLQKRLVLNKLRLCTSIFGSSSRTKALKINTCICVCVVVQISIIIHQCTMITFIPLPWSRLQSISPPSTYPPK